MDLCACRYRQGDLRWGNLLIAKLQSTDLLHGFGDDKINIKRCQVMSLKIAQEVKDSQDVLNKLSFGRFS